MQHEDNASARTRALGQLAVFLAVVALAPMLLHLVHGDDYVAPESAGAIPPTDLEQEIARICEIDPEVIFIGNSMLYTRIDLEEFERLTGRRAAWITSAGMASGSWFLALKNIVAESGVRPEMVFVFFRDQYLTYPEFRTTGMFGPYFESLRQPEEPIIDQVLGGDGSSGDATTTWNTNRALADIYGIRTQPARAQSNMRDLALDLTAAGEKKRVRREYMGERFRLEALRRDLRAEDAADDPAFENLPREFDPAPKRSFLPHIIDVASAHDLPVCFFRIKRRSDVDGTRPATASLPVYLEDLRQYVEAGGANLVDETGDDISADWYADGDHIAEEYRARYTAKFLEKVRPLLRP